MQPEATLHRPYMQLQAAESPTAYLTSCTFCSEHLHIASNKPNRAHARTESRVACTMRFSPSRRRAAAFSLLLRFGMDSVLISSSKLPERKAGWIRSCATGCVRSTHGGKSCLHLRYRAVHGREDCMSTCVRKAVGGIRK